MEVSAHWSSPRGVHEMGLWSARVEERDLERWKAEFLSKASSTTRHPDDDGSSREVVEAAVTANVCRARARVAARIHHPASKWPFHPASDLCSCHSPYNNEALTTQL